MNKIYLTISMVLICLLHFAQTGPAKNYQYQNLGIDPNNWTSIESTGTTAIGGMWLNQNASVPIGFSFQFEDNTYTSCRVSTNGYITFGTTAPAGGTTNPISGAEGYDGAVSPFGGGLRYSIDQEPILYQTTGTAPNRVFTVEWEAAKSTGVLVARDDTLNFQLKLFETSNKIQFIYGSWDITGAEQTPPTYQIGLRGDSELNYANRRDLGAGINGSGYGVDNINEIEFFNIAPAFGLKVEWTPCPTCVTKYWAGNGSRLTGANTDPTTDLDFNNAINWSITGPEGPVTATTAPSPGDSLVVYYNGNLSLSGDVTAKAMVSGFTFVDVTGEIRTLGHDLTLTGTLTMDLNGNNQPSNATNIMVVGDPTNNNTGSLTVNGAVNIGRYTRGNGAYSSIVSPPNSLAPTTFTGDVYFGNASAGAGLQTGANFVFLGTNQEFTNVNLGTTNINSTEIKSIVVGDGVTPTTLTLKGTSSPKLIGANPNGTLTIKSSSILDMEDKTFDYDVAGASEALSLEASGRIKLTANNFPSNVSEYDINEAGTVEFYGATAQTIPSAIHFGIIESTNTGARTLDNADTLFVAGNFISGTNDYTTTGSILSFDGTGAQTITGKLGNNANALNDLFIDNDGTGAGDGLILSQYLRLTGDLTLEEGKIDLNANSLVVDNDAVTAISSTNGYLLAQNNAFSGKLKWFVDGTTGARSIPFGNAAGDLTPIDFELLTGTVDTLYAASYGTPANNSPLPAGISSLPNQGATDAADNTVDRFYMLAKSGTGAITADVTFNYAASEAPTTNTTLETQRHDGTNWIAPVTGQTTGTNSVSNAGVADLGVFAIIDQTPVPFTADFTASATTVCVGETVQFTDQSSGTPTGWTWTITGATPATSTAQNPSVTYGTAGTYTVELTSTDGTSNDTETKTAYITVNDLPTATISGGGDICPGGSAQIDVALTGVGPWDITINDGTTTTQVTAIAASPYTFNATTSGTYTVDAVSDANCVGTTSGSASVNDVTGVTVSNLVETCDGNGQNYTVTFDISGGDPNTYAVTGGTGTLTGSTFTSDPIVSGNAYSFDVDDANNCSPQNVSGTVTCSIPCPANATLSGDNSFCSGSLATMTVDFVGTAPYDFTYSDGSSTYNVTGIMTTPYTFQTGTAGTYTLVSMNDNDCQGTTSGAVNLTEVASPTVSVGDEEICNGGSVTITPTVSPTGGSYLWSTNETTPSIVLSPSATNTFTLDYTMDGCTTTASFTVTVNTTPSTPTIVQNGLVLTSDAPTGNQWYKDGAILPGETNVNYTVTQNGVYHVVASAGNCSSDNSNEIEITNVGIEELILNGSIKVYPNPNNGAFKLSINEVVLNEIDQIEVMNVLGQVVRTLEVTELQNVNITELGSGVYFVNIHTTQGSIAKRVVKQ